MQLQDDNDTQVSCFCCCCCCYCPPQIEECVSQRLSYKSFSSFTDSSSKWARVNLLPAACCFNERAAMPDITTTKSQRQHLAGGAVPMLAAGMPQQPVAVTLSKNRSASVQFIHHSPLDTQLNHIWLLALHPFQNCNLGILLISIF